MPSDFSTEDLDMDDLDMDDLDMEEPDSRVFDMLGSRSPAQFAGLPPYERKAIFRRCLTQDRPVIIVEGDDDDEMNPDIAESVILRQQYFMGSDGIGKQLVKEAREMYYGENHFIVPLYWLGEFVIDSLEDFSTQLNIASLVGTITVEANVRDIYDNELYTFDTEGDPKNVANCNNFYTLSSNLPMLRKSLLPCVALDPLMAVTVQPSV